MTALRFQFSANERLKREQDIQTLFHQGKAFSSFPIKCIWLLKPCVADVTPAVKVGFSVPKKKIPRAVNRNFIKRRMRESWRLNKNEFLLTLPKDVQLHLFFVYSTHTLPDYSTINEALVGILNHFQQSKQF